LRCEQRWLMPIHYYWFRPCQFEPILHCRRSMIFSHFIY
jgi:hypothetical protein